VLVPDASLAWLVADGGDKVSRLSPPRRKVGMGSGGKPSSCSCTAVRGGTHSADQGRRRLREIGRASPSWGEKKGGASVLREGRRLRCGESGRTADGADRGNEGGQAAPVWESGRTADGVGWGK
jgi:hypothetical protein